MSEQIPFYHDGMRELQDRFDGRRVADALATHRRRWDFWPEDRVMIEAAPFFFIATSFGDYTDCSMRSGMPGFVKITGPGTIEFPEYDGNSMYRTLGNISRNPRVGLLFVNSTVRPHEFVSTAAQRSMTMQKRSPDTTRRNWSFGLFANCFPTVRARCMTWSRGRYRRTCRARITIRPCLIGKAGTISKAFSRNAIRIGAEKTSRGRQAIHS